ncbi:MAG: site-2 protease family protein, partial [Candidatus Eremiobacterota bacterium]
LGPALRACPVCHRLVHSERLKELAAEATRAEEEQRTREAVDIWRQTLDLVPPGSGQDRRIRARILKLGDGPAKPSTAPGWLAGLGVFGLFLWKFKFLLVALLSKGKLLLLGFTKLGTLSSMLMSLYVYGGWWGWKFALGVLLCVYVHEMGHVFELRQLGIRHGAPLFIPGLGAVVLMRDLGVTPHEDARIGLAGPWWGLGASLACWGLHLLTGAPLFAAVATVSAWLNLLNLIPVWCLDGSRGMRPLNRMQIGLLMGCGWGLNAATHQPLLVLFLVAAAVRWWTCRPGAGDWKAFTAFLALMVGHTLLSGRGPLPA